MRMTIIFTPAELSIAEKLVKRIKEAHPGFEERLYLNEKSMNGNTIHKYVLNDKRNNPNERRKAKR